MAHVHKEVPVPAAATPVTRVMTTRPITMRPDLGLDQARDLLLSKGLSRVPVVDACGRAVGMLSVTNLVAARIGHHGDSQPVQRLRVADVMRSHVIAVPESASVAKAAEILVAHGLHGAPVSSRAGVVIGFLSSSDVLAWLAGLR